MYKDKKLKKKYNHSVILLWTIGNFDEHPPPKNKIKWFSYAITQQYARWDWNICPNFGKPQCRKQEISQNFAVFAYAENNHYYQVKKYFKCACTKFSLAITYMLFSPEKVGKLQKEKKNIYDVTLHHFTANLIEYLST